MKKQKQLLFKWRVRDSSGLTVASGWCDCLRTAKIEGFRYVLEYMQDGDVHFVLKQGNKIIECFHTAKTTEEEVLKLYGECETIQVGD